MRHHGLLASTVATCLALFASPARTAGFADDFEGEALASDPAARNGWTSLSGDGEASVTLTQRDGHAVMAVDARQDRRGMWWAIIKRAVSPFIDAKALARPDRELRVEARVRARTAPHRINMSFNHSRTTDFHANLAEYDLADTGWHVISLTTKGFDARPGDEIFVQLAMIDWGVGLFEVDIDDIRVEVVDPDEAGPDLGAPLPYRPPVPSLAGFANRLPVLEDAIVDSAYPEVNFAGWADMSGDGSPALSVSGSQTILLRWDLSAFRGRAPRGWGVLELTTQSVQWAPTGLEEFGYLRVTEVLDGAADWTREGVTLDSLLAGKLRDEVIGQMFMDIPPAFERGGKTLIAVSPPVLQRLLSGRSKGLAIYPQGAVNASFYSGRSPDPAKRPTLYFDLE